LRWCGFVATRREHRTVRYRLADRRVAAIVELGRALLHDNAEHIAACGHMDGAPAIATADDSVLDALSGRVRE
jgi:hypothetical protein